MWLIRGKFSFVFMIKVLNFFFLFSERYVFGFVFYAGVVKMKLGLVF